MDNTKILNDEIIQNTAKSIVQDLELTYTQKAVKLFKLGFNCSQSVFLAFFTEYDMDFETAVKLSSSFGGGMGRLGEVCGAVSGMFMVTGMKFGYSNPSDLKGKTEHYIRIQELGQQFREENGSLICRELLSMPSTDPIPCTKEVYKKKPCSELVESAASILESYLKSNI